MGANMKSYLTGLMPNHFHLMVHVREVEVVVSKGAQIEREGFAFSEKERKRESFAQSETLSNLASSETFSAPSD